MALLMELTANYGKNYAHQMGQALRFSHAAASNVIWLCFRFYSLYIFCFDVYPSNCHFVIIICDLGGGSTGVVPEPRHRPLLFVSYRTARIREFPPPAGWPGL